METIMTMPAADVGTLHVRRTPDDSPTRFEVWHAYGIGSPRQVAWLIKVRSNWDVMDMGEEYRMGRSKTWLSALRQASHRMAELAHEQRTANERAEAVA